MIIDTRSMRFRKARQTSYTTNGYPTRVMLLGLPPVSGDVTSATTDYIFPLKGTGEHVPSRIHILPYGVGSDNNTGSFKLLGWRSVHSPADDGNLLIRTWLPVPLFIAQYTVSANVKGITGGTLSATDYFADTITITKEPSVTADVTRQGIATVFSPADDASNAFVDMPLYGYEFLSFDFTTGGSLTSCNALFAMY